MRDKIKNILKESDFEWTGESDGNEFQQYLYGTLSDWLGSGQIDDLEPYLAELPHNQQKDFVETLASILDDTYELGKTEGHDEGREEGWDDGHQEGWDEGRNEGWDEGHEEGVEQGENTCEEKCEEKWQDGYDTGHNDGHSEGHSEGYEEAQDECEECD